MRRTASKSEIFTKKCVSSDLSSIYQTFSLLFFSANDFPPLASKKLGGPFVHLSICHWIGPEERRKKIPKMTLARYSRRWRSFFVAFLQRLIVLYYLKNRAIKDKWTLLTKWQNQFWDHQIRETIIIRCWKEWRHLFVSWTEITKVKLVNGD